MMTKLEFAREKHRQLLVMMPHLIEEARARVNSEKEMQDFIDGLLDRIIAQRNEIKHLKRSNNK